MKTKELENLLEKYYSGESTQEEEGILRDYFSGESVHKGYEAERDIFRYYRAEKEMPEASLDFESRIMAAVDASGRGGSGINYRRYLLPLLGAAASILIVAGSYIFFSRNENLTDTYSDPQIAYLETRKILLDVSLKMNRATEALAPVGMMNQMTTKSFSAINKSTVFIEKNLKELDKVEFTEENSDL